MRLTPRNVAWLLRRSLIASFDDGCFSTAKGAAYSALLSFFPVLTSAATILVQSRAQFVSRTLQNALSKIVPPGTEDLVFQNFRVSGTRPVYLLIVAGVISVWAASGVIKSLMEGFQAAYRIPRGRGYFHNGAVAMALVLGAAVPLLGASLLVVFGGQAERAFLRSIAGDARLTSLSWVWSLLSRLAAYAVSFGATILITSGLYYFGPNRRQRWRYVWPGATLATVLWLLATSGFAWYVRNMAHYNAMYGSIGAGIALLVWMYLMAIIAMVGCEFNAQYEHAATALPVQSQ